MKLITYIIAFFAIISCLFACNRTGDRPDVGLNRPLDSLFNSMFAPDEPGAVVMVMHHDSIIYSGAFGLADLGTKMPMSDSTMINISSASKMFITAGIMRLVEEGRISLTDSLSKFFPEFPSPLFNGITIEHVMSHTTGLPDERPRTPEQWIKYLDTHSSAFGYGPDYRLYARGEELTRFFETIDTLTFVPGSKFEYQEAPFHLLPQIIEIVTGKRFASWMRNNVFDPAGLKDITYFTPDVKIKNMAHGYTLAKPGQKADRFYDTSSGEWVEADYGEVDFYASMVDVGIYTNAKELMKWVKCIFNYELLSKQSMDNILYPRVATPLPDVSYCLSAYISEDYGPRKVFHSRPNGGFATYTSFFPDENLYYFIIANRPNWNRRSTGAKVDSILRANHRLP